MSLPTVTTSGGSTYNLYPVDQQTLDALTSAYPQQALQGAPTIGSTSSVQGGNALTLGTVTFNSEETPSQIDIGTEVHIHVTDLIGGGRVIQTYGIHPQEITWNGRIWGPNVQARVTAIRAMLFAQAEVLFTWNYERYFVIIKSFVSKPMAIDAEYSIALIVTRDGNGAIAATAPNSIDQQTATLMQNINAVANRAGIIESTAPAGSVNAPNSTGPSISSVQTAITTAQQAIAFGGPIASLAGSNLTSTLAAVQSAAGLASAYANATSPLSTKIVPAMQMVSGLGLAAKNITEGQSAQVITVNGGTLAEIASTYFGNPDLAPQLAAVNGIQGLRLPPGIATTLTVPPLTLPQLPPLPQVSGGVSFG